MIKSNKHISIRLIFIIPLLAAILALYATRFNIGVSPDSTFYVSAAQSLSDRGEIRSIYEGSKLAYMTHYPPGYPIILSGINYFTHDVYEAARWCNAIFLFALLLFIGLVIRPVLSATNVLLTQLFLLCNLSLFGIYEMAWSEPPFIFLSLLGLYALWLFIERKNIGWLLVSGLIISMAVSVRYVGITLIMASVIILWTALSKENIWRKIFYITIHGSIASVALLYWIIRNIILVNNPTNRHFSFHPMTMEYYKEWLTNTKEFFIPVFLGNNISIITGALIFLGILLYGIFLLKRGVKNIIPLWWIYALTYLVFLCISNTFFDFTPLYFRTLSPVYIIFLITFLIVVYGKENKETWAKTGFLYLLLLVHVIPFVKHIKNIDDGKEYSSRFYMIPSTINGINSIPGEAKVFTNEVDRYYYLSKGKIPDWLKDWQPATEGAYYMVLFKNGRNYNQTFWQTSGVSWEMVLETEDVSIRKNSDKEKR